MNSNEKETKKQPHIENIDKIGTDYTFKRKIVWQNVFGIVFIHFGALYGLYLIPSASISTIIFGKLLYNKIFSNLFFNKNCLQFSYGLLVVV